jgi:hypothetical protein
MLSSGSVVDESSGSVVEETRLSGRFFGGYGTVVDDIAKIGPCEVTTPMNNVGCLRVGLYPLFHVDGGDRVCDNRLEMKCVSVAVDSPDPERYVAAVWGPQPRACQFWFHDVRYARAWHDWGLFSEPRRPSESIVPVVLDTSNTSTAEYAALAHDFKCCAQLLHCLDLYWSCLGLVVRSEFIPPDGWSLTYAKYSATEEERSDATWEGYEDVHLYSHPYCMIDMLTSYISGYFKACASSGSGISAKRMAKFCKTYPALSLAGTSWLVQDDAVLSCHLPQMCFDGTRLRILCRLSPR